MERDGSAVLFLEPSEIHMIDRLKQKKIPIEETGIREKKQQSIQNLLQNMCFKDPEIKYLGSKAFVSYVKSVYVQKDKQVFDLQNLPLEEYAKSLGLPGAPRIKFQKGDDAKRLKNVSRQAQVSSGDEEDDLRQKTKTVRTKYDRMFERQNQGLLSSHYANLVDSGDGEGKTLDRDTEAEDESFFNAKRQLLEPSPSPVGEVAEKSPEEHPNQKPKRSVTLIGGKTLVIDSKHREKLLKSKKKLLKYQGKGSKLVFDDDGNPHEVYEMKGEEDFKKDGNAIDQRQKFVDNERARVRDADLKDKALAKEKRKVKRDKRKERKKDLDDGVEVQAVLAPFEEDEDDHENADFDRDSDVGDGGANRSEDTSAPSLKRGKKRRKMEPVKDHASSHVLFDQVSGNLEDLEALATSYL